MKTSDILQIALIGLSGAAAAIYFTNKDGKNTSSSLKKNPKKEEKSPAEIEQASSFLATVPQDRMDYIISNRRLGKTSKKISLELGLTTQNVWDIVTAYETVNGPIETLSRSQEEALVLYQMYQGPPAMTIEEVAEKANMSNIKLRNLFRAMGYPLRDTSSQKDEQTRALHKIYSQPDSPPLSELATQAGITRSALLSRFATLGLPIIPKGKSGFRKKEVSRLDLDRLYSEYQGPLKPSIKQLAESIGLKEHTLYRRFKEAGFVLREAGHVLGKKILLVNDYVDLDVLYADYVNRSTKAQDLPEKYGVSFSTIVSTLAANGYPVADVDTRTEAIRRNLVKEYGPTIASLYRQGANLQGLYIEYKSKLEVPDILAILEEAGISIRDTEPVIKYYSNGYNVDRVFTLLDGLFSREDILAILKASKIPLRVQTGAPHTTPEYSQEEKEKSKKFTLLSEETLKAIPSEKFAEVNALPVSIAKKARLLGVSSVTFKRLQSYYS